MLDAEEMMEGQVRCVQVDWRGHLYEVVTGETLSVVGVKQLLVRHLSLRSASVCLMQLYSVTGDVAISELADDQLVAKLMPNSAGVVRMQLQVQRPIWMRFPVLQENNCGELYAPVGSVFERRCVSPPGKRIAGNTRA
jgi:hypothetical protein